MKLPKIKFPIPGPKAKKIIQLRLKTARQELKEMKNYNHIVVNDHLDRAHQMLKNIILSELTPNS